MAFPPQFLDEIRARVPLADVIGRRVKLQKRGREYQGLCPFHNEKTPSFTVNEDKGFFHCFGCGAHGDVIGFVMRSDGLTFPEAVENLAGQAGLEVPQQSPQERQRAEKAKGLLEIVEAACAWFEATLREPAGRPGLDYLKGRGFDEETIARFRLGFAPDGRDNLKRALVAKDIPAEALIEAGLVIRPDDGRPSYDRFRNRVIFPITDRRGRVIAFGGRILGDGQPKYLNSPETPLFHKGRQLYALDKAAGASREGADIVATEGYTDVIALHRAGFPGAVAPLGTALTESQIELLWRLADEPTLCFDGDNAGQRAAARAAERALPLLRPGKSLRFAMLPPGEDPDSLIRASGAPAMRELLDGARPLVDQLWELETAGRPADTPERRAGIRESLRRRVADIADRTVQEDYRIEMDRRLDAAFGTRNPRPHRGRRGRQLEGVQAFGVRADGNVNILHLRQQQLLLATLINHPALLATFAEDLGQIELAPPELDNLRQEIIKTCDSALDSAALRGHLRVQGYAAILQRLLCEDVYGHGAFSRPDADLRAAEAGWRQLFERFHRRRQYSAEIEGAVKALAEAPTKQNRAYLDRLREQQVRTNEGDWGTDWDVSDEGGATSDQSG